ncbi:damage-inducible protein DinB [Streptomyces sp. V2]|uniref:DinB family protein n=1 Tax=Streptomyces sp. V2 TaxID=1424099 RepID=UPI000D66D420|nr:DinB family protein [Streptomyces sp. V2]PWG11677.1 damage-inducible protein DinB [Streptomyces sp. V2]
MTSPRLDLLRWQTDLTWSLFTYHLDLLRPDDHLWEPADTCWTLHPDGAGGWTPDWAETEPDPVPVPTVAWVSWHLGWWLGTTTDHALGRTPRKREDVAWPGPGGPAVTWLRGLYEEWTAAVATLTDADLDRPSAYPWPEDAGLTLAHQLAWVNAELMKNVAEIGQLRLIRAVSRT